MAPSDKTGDTLSFRPYHPADREAVVTLLSGSEPWTRLGYTTADWERLFGKLPADRECLIAEQHGRVAGLALLRPRVLLGDYLELLAVAPEVRGAGVGSALLAHLDELIFSRAKNFYVCVSDFNEGARRFYLRHGFQEVGRLSDVLVAGSAEILMRKTTGPVRKT